MIAGVVSYILLCWGGGGFMLDWLFRHLLILLIFWNFLFSVGCWSAPKGFAMCVCVGLAHLVFYGKENKSVKCRNG